MATHASSHTSLFGRIVAFKFRSEDGAGIAVFKTADGEKGKTTITIKGKEVGSIRRNQLVELVGYEVTDPRHGRQFYVETWKKPSITANQKAEILIEGLIKGIGPVTAGRIVSELGPDAIDVIRNTGSKALVKIPRISADKAEDIYNQVVDNFKYEEIITEIQNIGFSTDVAIRFYDEFQENAVEEASRNPFTALSLSTTMTFQEVDQVAIYKLGILASHPLRLGFVLKRILRKKANVQGHVFVPEQDLITEMMRIMNGHLDRSLHIDERDCLESIELLSAESEIINEANRVYLSDFYDAECRLAHAVSRFRQARNKSTIDTIKVNKWLNQYQQQHAMILSNEQKQIVAKVASEQLVTISGAAGTGKTTTMKVVIAMLEEVDPSASIQCCAPTGKAARRLSEVTNRKVKTIHKLLRLGYSTTSSPFNRSNPLPAKYFIVDESSMIDLKLADLLFNAIPKDATVIMIGDHHQLPSVSAGQFFTDLMRVSDPVELKSIHRQSESSDILTTANLILNQDALPVHHCSKEFISIQTTTVNEHISMVIKSYLRFIRLGYDLNDIGVISPLKHGSTGIHMLNTHLQEILNPNLSEKDRQQEWVIEMEDQELPRRFRVGDKVIHLVNDPNQNVDNGDTGYITEITEDTMTAVYRDNQTVHYSRDDIEQVSLAYVTSVHKSQGSEYPIVIFAISKEQAFFGVQNLLYTGITRAKEVCLLLHQEPNGILPMPMAGRNSTLAERIMPLKQPLSSVQ